MEKLLKRILISTKTVTTWRSKNVFNDFVEERSSEFMNLEKRINPDNLIYKYKRFY